ncbi:general odorant-binding protein 83a-like [Pectinophora gossypiella]|uniref:general odorant-binding protein 83a-like n=1 Tax=Pectinophora gossypiella TaxID=13191 RepID=UPI00214EFFA0|nr:general odorant-binding protein 83a-like [Pectinophora gossypiella]
MERSVTFLLLLVCARAEFPTKEFVEQLRPTVEKCEEKTGVDKTLVEQFSKGESMVDDDKLKCYMKCIFVELELLNESNGIFRYEKMLNMLPEDMKSIAYNMGQACVHFIGDQNTDMCQVSYDLHRCWQKKDPQHYFLF